MKIRSKALLMLLSAVMFVTASFVGTIAYFTDSESATNTLTVGKVGIELDEAKVNTAGQPLDEKGKVVALDDADRVTAGNEYKLLPGHEYTKDPTVTVKAGSVDSYVRMQVTINEIGALEAALGKAFLPQEFVQGWNDEVWVCQPAPVTGNDSVTYEFRYHTTVNTEASGDKELDPLFTSIKVPEGFDQDDLGAIENLEIKVVAHAIQAAGFDSAEDAWTAFEEQVK